VARDRIKPFQLRSLAGYDTGGRQRHDRRSLADHQAAITMCRITVQTIGQQVVLKVEGALADPWVREFYPAWHAAVAQAHGRTLVVDLRGVCHVDAAGKDALTLMYLDGAGFLTGGCVMPEVVREVSAAAGHSAWTEEHTC
jgi:hypothetical protein